MIHGGQYHGSGLEAAYTWVDDSEENDALFQPGKFMRERLRESLRHVEQPILPMTEFGDAVTAYNKGLSRSRSLMIHPGQLHDAFAASNDRLTRSRSLMTI